MANRKKRFANMGLEAYNSTILLLLIVSPLITAAYLITIAAENIESDVVKDLVKAFSSLSLVGVGYYARGKTEEKKDGKTKG